MHVWDNQTCFGQSHGWSLLAPSTYTLWCLVTINGNPYSSIQVYNNLQPLNVCMSYQGTLNLVDKIGEDHDIEVQFWADEIKNRFLNPQVSYIFNEVAVTVMFTVLDRRLTVLSRHNVLKRRPV